MKALSKLLNFCLGVSYEDSMSGTVGADAQAKLVAESLDVLARLRLARTVGDDEATRVAERRLNWLIDTLRPAK